MVASLCGIRGLATLFGHSDRRLEDSGSVADFGRMRRRVSGFCFTLLDAGGRPRLRFTLGACGSSIGRLRRSLLRLRAF
jgi:hypothetical protein